MIKHFDCVDLVEKILQRERSRPLDHYSERNRACRSGSNRSELDMRQLNRKEIRQALHVSPCYLAAMQNCIMKTLELEKHKLECITGNNNLIRCE